MQKRLDPILRKHKVDMYICGHIHNFQHIRRPGSDIDYIVNSAGSLARKVKPTEGTVFCNPEPGFSVVSADKKELTLRMIDKKGNILHTISRKKWERPVGEINSIDDSHENEFIRQQVKKRDTALYVKGKQYICAYQIYKRYEEVISLSTTLSTNCRMR